MATPVEIYEAFKDKVGVKAAKMLAESLPEGSELATKADIERLQLATSADIESLRLSTKADIERLRADIFKWAIGFFAPLWAGTFGVLAAVLLKT